MQRHRFLREFSLWDPETSKPVAVGFDPEEPSEHALRTIYSDQALGTRFREGVPTSSSSQPSIMADMLEALAPEPAMRVLEIGTRTGYNAALLAEIVGSEGFVGMLDIDADLCAEARGASRVATTESAFSHATVRRAWPRTRRSIGFSQRLDVPTSLSRGTISSPRAAGW